MAAIAFLFSIYFFDSEEKTDKSEKTTEQSSENMTLNETAENNEVPSEGLALLIGKDVSELVSSFGEPSRKDPSSYGYEWWIYNQNGSAYMQAAVREDTVVSLYAIGSELNLSPFEIGQPVNALHQNFQMESTIDLEWDGNSYRFELSEEDMGMKPLLKIGETYAQVYIDKFEGTVSSVRFMDAETLIAHRPYELFYRGEIPAERTLTDEEWEAVDEGNEKQIFDITNVFRERMGLEKLEWSEDAAQVALGHSIDMHSEGYFSHESPAYGDLGDRLKNGSVKYTMAGENIAAKYVDGIAAFEGWLNSKGHREALLNPDFTHLGVGVYQKYYTQNFIKTL